MREKETEDMLTKIQEEKILREAMQKQRKEAEENEKKRQEAEVVNNSIPQLRLHSNMIELFFLS